MRAINKTLKTFFLWGLVFVLWNTVTPAHAEDISLTAEVDTHTIQAGSPVLLMLTVKGKQSVDPIPLPEIKGFKARYLGPRSQLSIVNGKSESSISFMYNLYGMELGHFQIPAVSATIDNKTYTTQPVDVEVVDQATTTSANKENQASVKDKIFMVLSVPTKEYFVGERIPLTIKLYVSSGEQVNLASNIDFKREGFDIGEVLDTRRYQQALGGENYDVVEFTTYVYPLRTGELTLGPAQLLCKIFVRDNTPPKSSAFDAPSVFNDDFFNDFFDNEWRELMVTSADISIKVLPLPEEGKPADFSGAVGKFNFDVSVSPAEVKVGDPLTLRMKIAGDNSLKGVSFPSPTNDPKFKLYEPQIREDKGEKNLEQVVIPTTDQMKEFPAVRFSYFDTDKRSYETITKGPFPVKVTPADQQSSPKVVGGLSQSLPAVEVTNEKLGQGISFIKDYPGSFRPVGFYLYQSPVFGGAVLLFVVFWLAGFAVYGFRYKLKTDTAFATKFLAPRKARRELIQARHYFEKGNQRAFYDQLFKTLQDYLSSKFHKKAASMTADTMEELLKNRTVGPDILTGLREFCRDCEMVQFASASVSKEKMEQSFISVQKIIDCLERFRS